SRRTASNSVLHQKRSAIRCSSSCLRISANPRHFSCRSLSKLINSDTFKENTACAEPLAKAEADVALIQGKLYFLSGQQQKTMFTQFCEIMAFVTLFNNLINVYLMRESESPRIPRGTLIGIYYLS
ncbi:hypothetical protein, partial [Sporomusa sp.]|uniref:hypothetical protein n=1 Tax=Sporomusa sp. TaxID=2078658 RepID=UPI002B83E386